jgi:hypothetical protein
MIVNIALIDPGQFSMSVTACIWESCFPCAQRPIFGIKKTYGVVCDTTAVSLKIAGGAFVSSSRRIFAVVVLMLVLFMILAIPSAAQVHGSASAHAPTFATAAPADTGLQNLPLTEPYDLPTTVLVTPLTSSPDYYPSFGGQAGGSAQEVVQPETRVQERTEDLIQPQPKIGER